MYPVCELLCKAYLETATIINVISSFSKFGMRSDVKQKVDLVETRSTCLASGTISDS